MDVSDLKGLFAEVKKRMDGQIEFVRKELAGVRTGRASTGLLDNLHVEPTAARCRSIRWRRSRFPSRR